VSVKLSRLVTYVMHDVPARDGIPSEMQYEECVKRAMADFGRRKPLVKETTLSIEANVASYALPADFLYVIDVEALATGEGGVLITPTGLIPMSPAFKETYTVAAGRIAFVPTPAYSYDRRLWYAAGYTLDATEQEYTDLTEDLVDVVLLKAKALATGIKAGKAADEAWQYAVGDERVNKEKLADNLRVEVRRLTDEYEAAVRSLTRNMGLRSTYLGERYDGVAGVV
jgi:hypothetical protein